MSDCARAGDRTKFALPMLPSLAANILSTAMVTAFASVMGSSPSVGWELLCLLAFLPYLSFKPFFTFDNQCISLSTNFHDPNYFI